MPNLGRIGWRLDARSGALRCSKHSRLAFGLSKPYLFLAAAATATAWSIVPASRSLQPFVGAALEVQRAALQPFRVRSHWGGPGEGPSWRRNGGISVSAAGKSSEAAAWHASMGQAEVATDTAALEALALSAARSGKAHEAVRWLKLLKESLSDEHTAVEARHTLSVAGANIVQACHAADVPNLLQESADAGFTCDELGIPSIVAERFRDKDAAGVERWIHMLEAAGMQPSALCYTMVIDVLSGSEQSKRAECWTEAFRQAGGAKLDGSSYGTIIRGCASAGDVRGAQRWLETMEKAGVEPDADTYKSMINAFLQVGDPVGAAKWFSVMEKKSLPLTEGIFASMIRGFAEAGNTAVALQWLQRMKHVGLQPNTDCFDPIIGAYARQGDADGACQLVEEMFATRVVPSRYSYSEVVQSFAKKADSQGAKKWLVLMTESGFEPDIDVYTAVLSTCAKAGLVSEAEEILSIIRDRGLQMKTETFNWALMAFARGAPTTQNTGRCRQSQETVKKAEGLFREMIQIGETPTPFTIDTLDKVLGKKQCIALCSELGVQVGANRSAHKKRQKRKRNFPKPFGPYHDGGPQIKVGHTASVDGGQSNTEYYEEDITWPVQFGQMERPRVEGSFTR